MSNAASSNAISHLIALLKYQSSLGLERVPVDEEALQALLQSLSHPAPVPAPRVPELQAQPVVTHSPLLTTSLERSLETPLKTAQTQALPVIMTLEEIRAELGDCKRCKLHTTRRNVVFGEGSAQAKLVFVGEAPGADEDASGRPFVGRAGQLLTKMIEAMGLTRESVYICNVLKSRPPNNRDPEPEEVVACEPFLIKQLNAIRPEVVVALGKHAAHSLLKEKTPISRLRGQWHTYNGIKLMPTYHPAYLLRNPSAKKEAWADLQLVMRQLGLLPA